MRIARVCAAALLASVLLAGCGAKSSTGDEQPIEGEQPAQSSTSSDRGAAQNASPVPADPEKAKAFLAEASFKNGDIYLDGGNVHINVVGLDADIERQFSARFTAGSYALHDVDFSIQQLEEAQQALHDADPDNELGIYGTSVDVIGNRLEITLPEEAADSVARIEKIVGKEIADIQVMPLGEPQIKATIAEIDAQSSRILVQEQGSAEPNYWFSFDDRSLLVDGQGAAVRFDDFQVGQSVRIWTTGIIQDSFPAQGVIRKIAIVPESANPSS
ncbi:DUF3221 domain-containing protein [Paenibacillus methanolicus]|uniref:Lipoprotein n=1 Tax=Paenibacillus methanolicus TaxID=582686 RepID=A0A5S5BTS0_9BACL|nr:DUF3221 domain-containing protein [Paenibacillus methanolicus]TYP70575.1 hypothetical protein BCM02_11180 [Paenibacillus methanolicus]